MVPKPTILLFFILFLSDYPLPAQLPTLNFQHLTPADGLSHSDVLDILQDRRGFIWLATRHGLNRYDGHSFKTYFADPEDTTSLSGNWLYNVAEDSLGNIWVSTLSNGICRLDPHTGVFTRFRHDPDDPNSLATDNTGDGDGGEIFVDRKGIVWISTDAGLERFDPATNIFQHFPDFRACLFQDSDGSLWFSSKESEMVKWDVESGENKRYRLPASSVSENVSIIKDPAGYYLLATRSSGIFRFDLSEEKLSHFPFPVRLNEALQSTFISEIAIAPTGLLWIITGGGIYTYDPETENWQHYVHDPLDPHTISTNSLLSILIDREKRVWTGVEGGGVNIWDPRLPAFEYIQRNPSDPYSLSHNNVTNIYEDTLGNLWVGTWAGVCRFDPETETFKNFNFLDGQASFNWWNTSKGRDGQLYFGCSRGFFIIYPETIQDNTQAPPVFFTDFQLHNRSVPIRGTPGDTLAWASPLEKDILFTDHIQLAHHQNDLSITFTALNYTDPMRNRYRYRLVGYDEEWIETDASKPFATYTNLSHGRYTFEVYGTNNDGVESTEPAILAITITPPWWLTWWAKGGYILLGLGVLGLIRRSELQKERRKLEHEQEKLAQQQRVNAVTSKFVPNAFIHSLGRKDIMEVQLGDAVAREVTVMFSDLRDYTRLAEQMTPEENFRFITAFNRRMGPIIQEQNGFINQYLGDAIMSIFQESPADALRAAVAMQRELTTYNEQRTTKGRPPLHMGIGLHTGPLIMGIIGDEQRLDAATISDTVNTAARVESLTKYYGVNILLTEESAERTASAHSGMGAQAFSTRYLGRVLVKGKAHPVGLYECFDGDAPGMAEKKRATLPLFEKGLQLYFDKSFAQAAVCFEKILHEHPEDRCAQLFLQKATRNMQEDVSEDWTGVEVMDRK